jgi:hypothetical protein
MNGLLRSPVFESGVAFIGSLTEFFQQHQAQDGTIYADTPGLDDSRRREEAGKEIGIALRQNGNYKIVFVVNLNSGRLVSADLVTIETVMRAINVDKKLLQYSVIVNKVESSITQDTTKKSEWAKAFALPAFPVPAIFFFGHDGALFDKNNCLFELSEQSKKLEMFIRDAPKLLSNPNKFLKFVWKIIRK